MDTYYALIADLDASRTYGRMERLRAQELLSHALAFLNGLHAGGLAVPVAFSAGDEVQGLFLDMGTAFLYFRELCIFMFPHRLHAGIGVGEWEVRIEGAPSPGQDGSAYHHARSAIDASKRDRIYPLLVHDGDVRLRESVLAGYSLGLCLGRSKRQGEVARLVELCRPLVSGGFPDGFEDGRSLGDDRRRLLKDFVDNARADLPPDDGTLDFPEGAVINTHVGSVIQEGRAHTDQNVRGLSYKLDKLAGASRTSIDRTMESGRILQERDAAALMVLSVGRRGTGWERPLES